MAGRAWSEAEARATAQRRRAAAAPQPGDEIGLVTGQWVEVGRWPVHDLPHAWLREACDTLRRLYDAGLVELAQRCDPDRDDGRRDDGTFAPVPRRMRVQLALRRRKPAAPRRWFGPSPRAAAEG